LKFLIRLLIVLVLTSYSSILVQAKEIKYNHNSITVSEIKKKVDFKVLTPKQIPNDWTLEIKTYPWGEKNNITNFSLHYMDRNDVYMMVSVDQRKMTSKKIKEIGPNAKLVDVNGNKGYFEEWVNSGQLDSKGEIITGGILYWIQDGTYIQMNSSRITKDKMLGIARSVN
jgi:hypothetical protein